MHQMKIILTATILCTAFLISACTAAPTPDLDMYHLRAVDVTEYDTSIIAIFCGTEGFNNIFTQEPTPLIYPVLEESESYLSFQAGFISEYDPNKHKTWVGDVDISKFPEYEECGYGKKYPYIYWFEFNVEKKLPYDKNYKKSYNRAYNEFKQQIINTRQIELGVVRLTGFDGNDLVSEKTNFLKLNEAQYITILEGMNYFEKHKRSRIPE